MTSSDVAAHAEHFATLGHDDRLAALEAVFESDGEWTAFSTIRDATDVRDPGRLSYHLRQLEPAFVEHGDSGYRLTRRGWNAAWTLRLGRFAEAPQSTTRSLGDDCVRCGGSLVLGYDDQFGVVACEDCERWFVRYLLSPGGVEQRTPDGVARILDHRCRELRRACNRGVCQVCAGTIERHLVADPDRYGHPLHVVYECDRCKCLFTSTVGAAHVAHPAVVAFSRNHGLGVVERPLWTLGFAFDPEALSVRDTDEPRAELTVAADDATLALTVGPDGGVESAERS